MIKRLIFTLLISFSAVMFLQCQTSTGWSPVRAKQNFRDSVYFHKDSFFNSTARFQEGSVKIGAVTVTANGAEMNILDGALLSTTELNRLVGVTSGVQAQINAKAPINNASLTGSTSTASITIGTGGTAINKAIAVDSSLAVINSSGDTLAPYFPMNQRAQLSSLVPMLRDTSVVGSFLYGSGLIRDTADFQNGAVKAFYNPKDTLVITSAKGVMKEGVGTESLGVQVSWHSSFMSGSATNMTSSASSITSTTTGTNITTLANNKIPPKSYVWSTLSGLTSGNKPSLFLYDLLGYRIKGGVASVPANPLLTGLKAYWNFDETSGTYVDEVNSNSLTSSGIVQNASGKINAGVGYDTNNDYQSIAYNSSLDFGTTDSFTISFWLYLNNTPATAGRTFYGCRFSMVSGYTRAIQIRFPTDGVYVVADFYNSTGTSYVCESNYGKFTTGTWNHFLIYKNSTTTKIYINGTDWTSSAYSTPGDVMAFNQSLFIGNYSNSNTGAIDGTIDEFAYWNRALTIAEIAEIYNSGAGKPYPFAE